MIGQSQSSFQPKSLLIVCVGNTCRSPMAEAFARRFWPNSIIKSVGICVLARNERAADEAINTMRAFGLDISQHKPTPISAVVVEEYEFVLALDKQVRRALLQRGVNALKIINLFVVDPFGNTGQYARCANTIAKRLRELSFPKTAN